MHIQVGPFAASQAMNFHCDSVSDHMARNTRSQRVITQLMLVTSNAGHASGAGQPFASPPLDLTAIAGPFFYYHWSLVIIKKKASAIGLFWWSCLMSMTRQTFAKSQSSHMHPPRPGQSAGHRQSCPHAAPSHQKKVKTQPFFGYARRRTLA